MIYEPQRIQQQGRIIEIGAQDSSLSGEHGKGKRIKKDRTGICENCGSAFQKRWITEPRRFCQNSCQHEFAVKKWIECSKCLAVIGIGSKTSGRLLGVTPSSITRKWKELGIKSQRPSSGSWSIATGQHIKTKKKFNNYSWWGSTANESKNNASTWMSEYNPKFPDWSILSGIKKLDVCLYKYIGDKHSLLKLREKAKERNKESNKAYIKKRKILDPGFRVQCNLKNRLKEIMSSTKKGGTDRTNNLTGCTTKQLASHLESQFKRGMTWENYGKKWHVDHILPCASFDHTDPRQVAQCWHWTNFRPLDAITNMKKSDTITEPQMNLLLCSSH